MWHMGDGWGWWMVFGWIWAMVLSALIVWAALALAHRDALRQPGQLGQRQPSALDVLEERYARSELTGEEFERMRRRLHAPTERETPSDEEKTE